VAVEVALGFERAEVGGGFAGGQAALEGNIRIAAHDSERRHPLAGL
jgi:hypothetical protein